MPTRKPRRDIRQGTGGAGGTGATGRPRGRGRFIPRRKVCAFCVERSKVVDYKDAGRLRRFVSDRYRMEPRRRTGTCATHQRELSVAIKRARHLAMIPFTAVHARPAG